MKNCELFNSEERLKAAWARLRNLVSGTRDEDFTRWACFGEAETALQPKFDAGRLLTYVESGGNSPGEVKYCLSRGPSRQTINDAHIYVEVVTATNREGFPLPADRLEPAALPKGVMALARAQVIEEIKAKCPVLGSALVAALDLRAGEKGGEDAD